MRELCSRLLCVGVGVMVGAVALASPAPAPLLVSPANGATNVDPDQILSWRWIDELMVNGGFDGGLSPGWYTGGSNPSLWQVYTTPTNRFATTIIPMSTLAMGQLIQDFYIPLDATSATLQWQERVWNLLPSTLIGRLRVLLFQGGGAVAKFEDATGSEAIFRPHTWVSRSADLGAYAGSSLQLVIQADTYSPAAVSSWYADVDSFTLRCEHGSTPEFQVYVGKSQVLGPSNQVGTTTSLSYWSLPLDPNSTYYWKVAAVRDSVTNYSATSWFRTGQRALPQLTVAGLTASTAILQFASLTNRFYTIEQTDALGADASWSEATVTTPGFGGTMQMEAQLPWNGVRFWRVHITP
ncbi:MAG TPA: hypothetical protein VJA21_13400 [Verrucomicrobiae bacterium]